MREAQPDGGIGVEIASSARWKPRSQGRFVSIAMSLATAVLAADFGVSLVAVTQDPAAPSPRFDVASVKPHRSNDDVMFALWFHDNGRLTATGSVRMLIRTAYRLQEAQLVGGPGWLDSDLFDIVATAEGNPTPDAVRLMLRALLTERFMLRVAVHRREMPVYALTAARSDRARGPRLSSSAADCDAPTADKPGGPVLPALSASERLSCGVWFAPGTLTAGGVTMADLASNLSMCVDRLVTDQTSIPGRFDVRLTWRPDVIPQIPTPLSSSDVPVLAGADPDAPSIFTALQEQLGLKLEAQRGPAAVFVVERIERPIAD